jgi:hypothetical protein
MNTGLDLDELTRRTRRREFDDGLMDFVFGGFALVGVLLVAFISSTSGMTWMVNSLIRHRDLTIIGLITLIPIMVLIIEGAKRLIGRIRRATFWRDSGFVTPLRQQGSWPINFLAAAIFISVVIVSAALMYRGVIGPEAVFRSLVSGAGMATGVMYFGMGVSLKLRRYQVVGIVGGLLSAGILLTSASYAMSWVLFGIAWGTVFFISGSWALRLAILSFKAADHG